MNVWIALGRTAAGYVGYTVQNGQVMANAQRADAAAVLAALDAGDHPVVRIGSGEAAVLPAPVLPNSGPGLPALTQVQPADIISAWARVWLAGYRAAHPDWDGIACVIHDDVVHWLHISAEEVVSSTTSLTPRLFKAMGLGLSPPDPQAMADTLSRPERLMTQLRAAEVRGDAGACLGHFIGADLAATRAYWLGQQVVVVGEGEKAEGYAQALATQGVPVNVADPDDLVPQGLAALDKALFAN